MSQMPPNNYPPYGDPPINMPGGQGGNIEELTRAINQLLQALSGGAGGGSQGIRTVTADMQQTPTVGGFFDKNNDASSEGNNGNDDIIEILKRQTELLATMADVLRQHLPSLSEDIAQKIYELGGTGGE